MEEAGGQTEEQMSAPCTVAGGSATWHLPGRDTHTPISAPLPSRAFLHSFLRGHHRLPCGECPPGASGT